MQQLRNKGELQRLASFANWPSSPAGVLRGPIPNTTTSPVVLARSGFRYTGNGDVVTCPICRIEIAGWLRPDSDLLDPRLEHKRRSPLCSLALECSRPELSSVTHVSSNESIRPSVSHETGSSTSPSPAESRSVNNTTSSELRHRRESTHQRPQKSPSGTADIKEPVHIDRNSPDFNQLRLESVRLGTFYDWPATAPVKSDELAADGWFYTGQTDRVRCAFCRGVLFHWARNDKPETEHRRHFPDCPFVRGANVGNVPAVTNRKQEPSTSSVSSTSSTAAAAESHDRLQQNGDSAGKTEKSGLRGQHSSSAAAADDRKLLAERDEASLATASILSLSDEEQRLIQENQRLFTVKTCKVCMDQQVNTVFLPCGHLVSCHECAPKLRNCPICRTYIRGTVKTELS